MRSGKALNTAFTHVAHENAWIFKGTSKHITSISSPSLELCSSSVGSGSGFDLLCSFNRARGGEPLIYVPGAPRQWTPVTLPVTLPKDSGADFTDQNSEVMSPPLLARPFIPLFNALRVMRPSFDFTAVDLLANRSTLHKLFSFTSKKFIESFRIDLHMVQNTLIMICHPRTKRQVIHRFNHRNYGHAFEATFTTPGNGLEASHGHHRIINYALGDLNCVVQHEVDAWYEAGKSSVDSTSFQSDPDKIVSSFTGLSLSESAPRSNARHTWTYPSVLQRGHNIISSKLAEIKTHGPSPLRLSRIMPQLWLGRTPYLMLGMHGKGNGVFRRVNIHNVAEKFPAWEKRNQDPLRRLSRLIAELRSVSQKLDDGACIVTCDHKIKPARLEIFAPSKNAKICDLPIEFIEKFWKESAG